MAFSVTVRDRMMVAHSLRGAVFGPAQRLHGATYVIEATFHADALDADGVVLDIGRAGDALAAIVATLTYRNLDDEPVFAGVNTTTERLSQHIGERLLGLAREGAFAPSALTRISVTLRESPDAWTSFEAEL
jgi:6-pyruvoyl-tetrahydropterin synthase